ncbi:unnamed protein product [Rotaria sp. Silwood1]|nr:unnamed protein product [Rotaria sp. Silwood1]
MKYPFKPYHKNKVVEDDEDDFVDIAADVEDELVEAEQTPDDIKLGNNKQLNQNDNITISSDIGIPSPVLPTTDLQEDEFISDDDEEESNDIPSVLPSSIDNVHKQMLEIQHKTHTLVIRTRKLVGIIRSIAVIDQYVRNHENGPKNGFILDVQIRWNSTFFMLQRVIHHQLVVRSVFIYKFPTITAVQKSSLANAYLDYDQWDLMQALHDVLAPFEMATRSLSGKHYATLALAYTTINIIRFGLQSKENDSPYLALLKKSILAQFELYFDIKMTKTQKELMIIASYLDPEAHDELSEEDKQTAKTILPGLMKNVSQSIGNSSISTSSIVTKTKQTLTDKLKNMVGISTNVKLSSSLTIEHELVLFSQAIQSFESDFSSFWLQYRDRFSRLYRIALRVSIIPATSVPSESIFSVAGYVARKQRASLSSKSLRHLMVLKERHRLDALRTISDNSMY